MRALLLWVEEKPKIQHLHEKKPLQRHGGPWEASGGGTVGQMH